MRDLLARKATARPLDVQLDALRRTYGQIPPDQQPSFLARLDEVDRAWAGQLTAEAVSGRTRDREGRPS
jgi:hypothetical protein